MTKAERLCAMYRQHGIKGDKDCKNCKHHKHKHKWSVSMAYGLSEFVSEGRACGNFEE